MRRQGAPTLVSMLSVVATLSSACGDDGADSANLDVVDASSADAVQADVLEHDTHVASDAADAAADDVARVDSETDAGDEPDVPDAITDVVTGDVPSFANDPLDWDLGAPGPFAAGFRRIETTYVPPGESEPRVITVDVWYPASEAEGAHPAYLGGTLFLDRQAWTDAPLARSPYGDTYPVHVHSHGHQGFGGTSADLMRYFASHGWVAVAPDHVGNLLNDNLDPMPVAMSYYRSFDITAALDAVAALPEGDPLAGVLDTSRVVMSGHSRGVHTVWATIGATFDTAQVTARCDSGALQLCNESTVAVFEAGLRDPRIVAAIPMAGSIQQDWFGDDGHSSVDVPILAMSGTNDPVGADRQFEITGDIDLRWVEIEGGCHQTFALGGCSTLDDALGYSIINTYALAFARKIVLGDDDPRTEGIVDGSIEVSTLAEFHAHE